MATCSWPVRYQVATCSWPPDIAAHSAYDKFSKYKYLSVNLVFSLLGFWGGNFFLVAPFPDHLPPCTLFIVYHLVYVHFIRLFLFTIRKRRNQKVSPTLKIRGGKKINFRGWKNLNLKLVPARSSISHFFVFLT